jgi:hypothetical protein
MESDIDIRYHDEAATAEHIADGVASNCSSAARDGLRWHAGSIAIELGSLIASKSMRKAAGHLANIRGHLAYMLAYALVVSSVERRK